MVEAQVQLTLQGEAAPTAVSGVDLTSLRDGDLLLCEDDLVTS